MFINAFLEHLWEPVQKEYEAAYKLAMGRKAEEIFHAYADKKMKYYQYPGVNMNMLPTCGCSHRYDGKRMSGCSMCNYHSELAQAQGGLRALREKNAGLYALLIHQIFSNGRGRKPKPNVSELLTGYNTFDTAEVPEELFEQLYDVENLFSSRPFRIIVEVRANDVTEEKLRLLKKYVPKRTRVSIEMGVEIGNEWFRNHWLNKNITNQEIESAIHKIHEAGYKVNCDILLGLPGLPEELSIQFFEETVFWLDSIGADEIIVAPLNRKKYTLQGYLYEEMQESKLLRDAGIVQGEHTGLPWLFSVMEGLTRVFRKKPSLSEKIYLIQLSENTNSIGNSLAYNADRNCTCNLKILQCLRNFQENKDALALICLWETMKNNPCQCYEDYQKLLTVQKEAGEAREIVWLIANEIKMKAEKENTDLRFPDIESELRQLDIQEGIN